MGHCFCGQDVSEEDLDLIKRVVASYGNLSRTEIAKTLCELLGWRRRNGGLKDAECRIFLEKLERIDRFRLPARRPRRPFGSPTSVSLTPHGARKPLLECTLAEMQPLRLVRTISGEHRTLWRELIGRYHYLGHKVAFGAHLRYLIQGVDGAVLGCLQFSSPAWRMSARDAWLGWSDETRGRHLQWIINNSRFLILPWVRIKNLASHALSLATRIVVDDWKAVYGLRPLLAETLVDGRRFSGTCYQAANWLDVGETVGRGRQDQYHRRHGACPKRVFLYPLAVHARRRLCQAIPNG